MAKSDYVQAGGESVARVFGGCGGVAGSGGFQGRGFLGVDLADALEVTESNSADTYVCVHVCVLKCNGPRNYIYACSIWTIHKGTELRQATVYAEAGNDV